MKKNIIIRVVVFLAIAMAAAACVVSILTIEFTNCKAGAEETIIVKTEFRNGTGCNGTYLVFAALFPADLKISETATVTYTSKNFANHNLPDVVDEPMVLMEATELEKFSAKDWPTTIMTNFGTMGNFGDFEWVVWRTKERCDLGENGDDSPEFRSQADIKITFMNGPKDIKFNFAAMYATTTIGLDPDESWGVKYCKPVVQLYQTTGGSALEDYTVPKLVSTVPVKMSFEDVFCVNFVSKLGNTVTALADETDVYLMGKVVLEDGTEVLVDKRHDESNRMSRSSEYEYMKYIYPRQFFGVLEGDTIAEMYLWFENVDGTKIEDALGNLYAILQTGTLLQ